MSVDFDVVDALAGFAEDLHGEGNFALRLHDAVKKMREQLEWQAACTKALMESQERQAAEILMLRKALGEIHEEAIEAGCESDCPPEWARCAVCRIRVKAGSALREEKK